MRIASKQGYNVATMTLQITPEKMAEYRQGHRKRQEASRQTLEARFQLAWEVARQGAAILYSQFQAEKVVVFGSLVNKSRFHTRSDIDLVAWGIAEEDYWRALGRLLDLTTEFSIDFIRFEEAHEHIKKVIDSKGVLL